MSSRETRCRIAGNPHRVVVIPERAQIRAPSSQRAPAVCLAIEEKASDRRARGNDRCPRASSGGLFYGIAARGALGQVRWLKAFVINPGKVEGIADPKIVIMLRQPVLRRFSAAVSQMRHKGPLGIELAGDVEPEHRLLVVDRMDVHIAEALALEVFIVDDFPEESERTELFEQARIEGDLIQRLVAARPQAAAWGADG